MPRGSSVTPSHFGWLCRVDHCSSDPRRNVCASVFFCSNWSRVIYVYFFSCSLSRRVAVSESKREGEVENRRPLVMAPYVFPYGSTTLWLWPFNNEWPEAVRSRVPTAWGMADWEGLFRVFHLAEPRPDFLLATCRRTTRILLRTTRGISNQWSASSSIFASFFHLPST